MLSKLQTLRLESEEMSYMWSDRIKEGGKVMRNKPTTIELAYALENTSRITEDGKGYVIRVYNSHDKLLDFIKDISSKGLTYPELKEEADRLIEKAEGR